MFEFIKHFASALSLGQRIGLEKVVKGSPEKEETTTYTAPTFTQVSNSSEYNTALTQIYSSLHALYAESGNVQLLVDKIDRKGSEDITTLRAGVEDLEARVRNTTGLLPSGAKYTDNVIETFNTHTQREEDARYYQNGTLPKGFVDAGDSLLKLPIRGEFLNVLSEEGIKPSTVFLDKVLGTPIGDGNEVSNAFDRTLINFWAEPVMSQSPIFADFNTFTWLPHSYSGGAACRVRVDFERRTQVSELDIRPIGQHQQRLLSFGWTSGLQNSLLDPTFRNWWGNGGNIWSLDSYSFGVSGSSSGAILEGYGPDLQTALYLHTYTPTGSVSATHSPFQITNDGGLEVSFLLKALGDVPVEATITFYTSGSSLYAIKEVVETVTMDSLGWTKVILTYDPPRNATHAKFKIGIPPNFERLCKVWVCSPHIETIRYQDFGDLLGSRKTIFIPAPVVVKTAYLVLSQEHYDFKNYTVYKDMTKLESPWSRLQRKKYVDTDILTWEKRVNQKVDQMPQPSTVSLFSGDTQLRSINGEIGTTLGELESVADQSIAEVKYSGYEYLLGAFEIYFKHVEYAARSRFVTPPIRPKGEIRELQLQAIEITPQPGLIEYRLTLNPTDTPEGGKIIMNSLTAKQGLEDFNPPPSTLSYKGTATDIWSSSSTDFVWYGEIDTSEYQNQYDKQAVKEVEFFKAKLRTARGSYVQYQLPSAVDLRGATNILIDFNYFAFVDPDEVTNPVTGEKGWSVFVNTPLSFNFSVSEDGTNFYAASEVYRPLPHSYEIEDHRLLMHTGNIELTGIHSDLKDGIKYIRIEIKDTFDPYGRMLPPPGATANSSYSWLAIRRVRCVDGSGKGINIRFIPATETSEVQYAKSSDYIVPVKFMTESIKGSDRNGKVQVTEYPYLNREKIYNLVTLLSSNTGGRRIEFDPNTATPKYLVSSTQVSTTTGYRPVLATLYFPNSGIIARPDTLGKPTPGDIGYIQNEILEIASVSQTTTTENTDSNPATTGTTGRYRGGNNTFTDREFQRAQRNIGKKSTQSTQSRSLRVYQTAMKPIVSNTYGSPVQCWWYDETTGATSIIDALYLKVDALNGLIEVNSTAPGSGYTQVLGSYYYVMDETSLRESFQFPDLPTITSAAASGTNVQSYPITRNVTDYMMGTTPQLNKTDLDPMSSTYYPVYEYYVNSDGELVFAENMHTYSDTPAVIEVEYETLAISPRLSIDFTRPTNSSQTPAVDTYTLLMNVRRG